MQGVDQVLAGLRKSGFAVDKVMFTIMGKILLPLPLSRNPFGSLKILFFWTELVYLC